MAALSLIKVENSSHVLLSTGPMLRDVGNDKLFLKPAFTGNFVINIDVCPESKCLYDATQHEIALSFWCWVLLPVFSELEMFFKKINKCIYVGLP